jgi:hypothetical protein
MTKAKNFRHLLSFIVVTVSLGAPLPSESKIIVAMRGDDTHRQSTPSTQASKTALPAQTQSDVDRVSPTKSASLITEKAAVKPPEVSYDQGQLTIIAENVSLSVVLDAVRRVMGADIQMPPGAANQLIWVRSGPGPARRVLRDLLDGTDLDYVIQASETDIDGVRSVLLTARSKGGDSGDAGSSPVHSLNRRMQPGSVPPADSSDTDIAPPVENVASSGEPAPTASIDPASASSGQLSQTNVQPSSLGSQPSPTGSPEGGSEQMIQQLQTLYQQRRQMQMQQNQKLPTAN